MVVYRDRDMDSMQDSETFFTVDSKVLTIRRNQDGKKGDLQIKVKHAVFSGPHKLSHQLYHTYYMCIKAPLEHKIHQAKQGPNTQPPRIVGASTNSISSTTEPPPFNGQQLHNSRSLGDCGMWNLFYWQHICPR